MKEGFAIVDEPLALDRRDDVRALGVGVLLVLALLVGPVKPAAAQDLASMLKQGPLVSVEVDQKGRFASATAVLEIARPPEAVWQVVTDFARYKEFIPKVEKSDVKPAKDGGVDLTLELDVPGPDPEYTCRYVVDAAHRIAVGKWVKGDLDGTWNRWRIEPGPNGGSLVYYTTSSLHFSSMLQSLEDDQQSITVGVNVGAALATVKAIKRRAESTPWPPKAAATHP